VMSGGHEYSRVCELSLCELIDVVLNRTAETDGLQYVTAKQCNALVHILSARHHKRCTLRRLHTTQSVNRFTDSGDTMHKQSLAHLRGPLRRMFWALLKS
jgi:hypothetical protein